MKLTSNPFIPLTGHSPRNKMKEEKYYVGQTIQSGDGTEYVVSAIWEQKPQWADLELRNKETGEEGSLRVGIDKIRR